MSEIVPDITEHSIKGSNPADDANSQLVNTLPRRLGLLSAAAVLIGSVIGGGIFRSPAGIADKVPVRGWYLFIWVLGGLFTLAGALSYAELSAALPRTGGIYIYLREGFGRLPAFLFGWSQLTLIRGAALGAIATVFAEYFVRLLGLPITVQVQTPAGTIMQSGPMVHYVAAAAIMLVAIFNLVGINVGALVQNLTALTKFGALALLVLAAFLIGSHETSVPAAAVIAPIKTTSLSLMGLALISVLYVYDGWADVTCVSGEIKKPERNLPLTLILGTFAIIAIYVMTNLAYLQLLDLSHVAQSKLVAADAAYRIFGGAGAACISVVVMLSTFGTLNGGMMTGSRIFFAMADDQLFFKQIGLVHPRFKTPYVAIGLSAALAMAFVMVRTFEQLSDLFVFAIWPFYALGVAAVYALRRRQPDLIRPYRAWGYPFTPAIFILATLLIIGNALVADMTNIMVFLKQGIAPSGTGSILLVAGIILAGIPVYHLWRATIPPQRNTSS